MIFNSLIFIGLAALWWYQTSRRRDQILALLRRWCGQQAYVLLDDTVIWRGWQRQAPGVWRWYWVYEFEISRDGMQRIYGKVLLDTSTYDRAWISVGSGENQLFEAIDD